MCWSRHGEVTNVEFLSELTTHTTISWGCMVLTLFRIGGTERLPLQKNEFTLFMLCLTFFQDAIHYAITCWQVFLTMGLFLFIQHRRGFSSPSPPRPYCKSQMSGWNGLNSSHLKGKHWALWSHVTITKCSSRFHDQTVRFSIFLFGSETLCVVLRPFVRFWNPLFGSETLCPVLRTIF